MIACCELLTSDFRYPTCAHGKPLSPNEGEENNVDENESCVGLHDCAILHLVQGRHQKVLTLREVQGRNAYFRNPWESACPDEYRDLTSPWTPEQTFISVVTRRPCCSVDSAGCCRAQLYCKTCR